MFWLWDTVCCTVCVNDWFVPKPVWHRQWGVPLTNHSLNLLTVAQQTNTFVFGLWNWEGWLRHCGNWAEVTVTHLMWPKNKVKLRSTPWVKPVYVPLIQSTELSRIYKHSFWIIYHGIKLLSITTLFSCGAIVKFYNTAKQEHHILVISNVLNLQKHSKGHHCHLGCPLGSINTLNLCGCHSSADQTQKQLSRWSSDATAVPQSCRA